MSWLINRGYTFFEIFIYNIVGTNQFLIGLLVFFYMTYQVTILQTCERENTVHLIPSVFDKLICQKILKNGPVVEKKAQGLSRTALRRAVRGQRQR